LDHRLTVIATLRKVVGTVIAVNLLNVIFLNLQEDFKRVVISNEGDFY
jgi:hypothetical protein